MPTRDDNVPDFMRVKHETPAIFQKYEEAQDKADRLRAAELAVLEAAEAWELFDGELSKDDELREAVRNLKAARGK